MNFEYDDSFGGYSYYNHGKEWSNKEIDKCCCKTIEKAFCCCKWNSDNYNCNHNNSDHKGDECKDYNNDRNCGCKKRGCWDNFNGFDYKKDCCNKRDENDSNKCRRMNNRCCCRGFCF